MVNKQMKSNVACCMDLSTLPSVSSFSGVPRTFLVELWKQTHLMCHEELRLFKCPPHLLQPSQVG